MTETCLTFPHIPVKPKEEAWNGLKSYKMSKLPVAPPEFVCFFSLPNCNCVTVKILFNPTVVRLICCVFDKLTGQNSVS